MSVQFIGSRKQRKPLIGLEHTTDRYPPITSQTGSTLRHTAFLNISYTPC